ncbi:MAG TPA: PDZ domain-containing protein, partial [Rectinemataceae bacterium]|nr:PDZ domain-containing protein [Rectinemataceae bacterium]
MRYSSFVLPFCLAFLVLSCASPPPPAPTPPPTPPAKTDIWPKIYNDETYLSLFASTWSEDEAVGAIRNLQNSMVEFNANLPFSELNVDPYGMRARWSWIENGSFQKSAGVVVPFDQVSSFLLEHYPSIDKDYKWGLLIYITGGSPVSLRMPTRDLAERLGKAILILAKARGAKPSMPNARFGAAIGLLSEAQAQAAGILQSGGVIVSWIFKESPAEKAGFSPQDIITSAEGKPVQKGDDLFSAIDAAAASGAKEIKIAGIRRSYRTEGKT